MVIDTKTFLSKIEQIAEEEPSYRHGGFGKDGTCDCIGLIIGAIRRAGGEWTGLHGSNYAARRETVGLQRIQSASSLMIGDVVYKAHEPGEPGYDAETINKRYKSSPDKRDYYHVGVVLSVVPLRIRHMTTQKPKIDTKIGKWGWHGKLKRITGENLDGGDDQMGNLVQIRGGNENTTVNMRSGPSKDRKIIYDVQQGSAAELLEVVNAEWSKIRIGNHEGYVQSVFVHKSDQAAAPDEDGQTGNDYVMIKRDELERVYDIIGDMLGLRG